LEKASLPSLGKDFCCVQGLVLENTWLLGLEKACAMEAREEILTLPAYAAPEQHFRSTQLAVCQRPLKVTDLSVWIDLLPGQEVYIGLEFHCEFLPLLISPHVTIGKSKYEGRIKINKLYENMQWTVHEFAITSATLSPYGGGYNWEIEAATDFYWLCRQLREIAQQAGLEGLWLPTFHVS
jgi:hypothetical protein